MSQAELGAAAHCDGSVVSRIEAGMAGHLIAIRDTNDRTGPELGFTAEAWQRFAATVKSGTR